MQPSLYQPEPRGGHPCADTCAANRDALCGGGCSALRLLQRDLGEDILQE